MLLIILVIVIVVALIYGFRGNRALNRNEKLYLKSRGYEPPIDLNEGPPASKEAQLVNLIESLGDISPYARQKAAEDLSRMCASGHRDERILPSLIQTLDDGDASVRGAVAQALGNLGDSSAIDLLKQRMEVEESIHVKVSLQQALERLGGQSSLG